MENYKKFMENDKIFKALVKDMVRRGSTESQAEHTILHIFECFYKKNHYVGMTVLETMNYKLQDVYNAYKLGKIPDILKDLISYDGSIIQTGGR